VECYAASIATNDAQVLVRQKTAERNILNVQDLNAQSTYLAGRYKLEVLTLPEAYIDTSVAAFAENKMKVPGFGTLSMINSEELEASVYTVKGGVMQLVERFDLNGKTNNRKLQPGPYRIVYKAKNNYHSESTKSQLFTIEEDKIVVITL
jgi:hypothetical protein